MHEIVRSQLPFRSKIIEPRAEPAESELSSMKCSRVTLDTTEPLQRAVCFYEKHGYRPSGRVTDFFGMPLHEYVKQLTR